MGAIPGMIQDLLCISQLATSPLFLKRWTEYWVLFPERNAEIPAVWCIATFDTSHPQHNSRCMGPKGKSWILYKTKRRVCRLKISSKVRHDTKHKMYYCFYKRVQRNDTLKKKKTSSQLDTSRKIIRAVWDIKGRTDMQYYNFSPSFGA